MEVEDILKKIEATYAAEKGKGFINHLLRAFFPVDRASLMLVGDGRKMFCCITGERLSTRDDQLKRLLPKSNQMLKESVNKIKAEAAGEEYAGDVEFQKEIASIQAMEIAIISEKSDKILSRNAYQALQSFYANGILRGGDILRIAKNEQAKAGIIQLEERGTKLSKAEKNVLHKVAADDYSKGGLNLGEIESLQALKKRFQDNEK